MTQIQCSNTVITQLYAHTQTMRSHVVVRTILLNSLIQTEHVEGECKKFKYISSIARKLHVQKCITYRIIYMLAK